MKNDLPVELSMKFLRQELYVLSEAHPTGVSEIVINDEDY